jgi:GNAT superfamily N-acetyltransferase
MMQSAIVQSIASASDAIGARAAHHIDLTLRHIMSGQGAESGDGYLRVVTGEPHPLGNVAIVSDPAGLQTTATAIAPLLACRVPTSVLFPNGLSGAVNQSLAGSGYESVGTMPAMAVDLHRLAATALPSGYDWTRIGDGDDGRAWTDAFAAGYEIPRGLARLFSPECLGAQLAPDAQIQFFAIHHNGRFVATSLMYLADGLAGIYCVATLAHERGKGLGAHVTAEPLRIAQRLGYRVGILQSSTAGHSVYLRLGFADFASVPMFVRMPA